MKGIKTLNAKVFFVLALVFAIIAWVQNNVSWAAIAFALIALGVSKQRKSNHS